MTIIDFPGGIHKDTNVIGYYKTYLGKGQSCGTIWFKDVETARKALEKDGIKTGSDLMDCTQCAEYYSSQSDKYNKHSGFKCSIIKHKYAASFE